MASSNHLLLGTKAEEDQADDLLASISRIAIADTPPDEDEHVEAAAANTEPKIKKKKRKSRFFFTPSKSFIDEVEERKDLSKPTVLSMVDQEVEARRKTYRNELPDALQERIEEVREFFLTEVGPVTLGGQAGALQAMEVVQRVLGTEIDNKPFAQFERMLQDAVTIKMARFIAGYFDLPTTVARQLVETIQPKKEAFLFNMGEERRGRGANQNVPTTVVSDDEKN